MQASSVLKSKTVLIVVALVVAIMDLFPHSVHAVQDSVDQWSRWRGPQGNGIAALNQEPVTEWSASKNVVWRSDVPGRGHSSPMLVGDKIFLTTAIEDSETHAVLCYDRSSGKQLWKTDVNQGGFPSRIHGKNTYASSTVATDGELVFAVFNHHQKIEVFALDFDGKLKWQKDVGNYKPMYPFGFGASPTVHRDVLLVTNENQDNGGIYALETKTGKQKWMIDRDGLTSYSTPVVAKIDGKEQLLISGGKAVQSYDLESGKVNWSVDAKWIVTCGTLVWDGNMVFASGGYPVQQTVAINAKKGEVVWQNAVKCYEQSMLAYDGYVYAHADNGAVYCWRASDGATMWKERFDSPVSVSPTLVDGNVFFTSENGKTLIVKATPDQFKVVATNQLGDSAFASPAFCGNQMFVRVGEAGKESLYCVGEKN